MEMTKLMCDPCTVPALTVDNLFTQLEARDISEFCRILDAGSEADVKDVLNKQVHSSKMASCLDQACIEGVYNIVEILLNHGADPNKRNELKDGSPLHFASERGHARVVSLLLNHDRINVNPLTQHGETPLHRAIRGAINKEPSSRNSNLKCVLELVGHHGIKLDIQDNTRFTAVHIAACNKLWDFVEVILDAGANMDITINNNTTRSIVIRDKPQLLTGKDYPIRNEPEPNLMYMLFDYLERGKEREFLALAENNNIDVNNNDGKRETLLQAASRLGLAEVVHYLLQNDADPNKTFRSQHTPIILASEKGYYRVVEFLLKNKNIDISIVNDVDEQTAIHSAVTARTKEEPSKEISHLRCLKLLLEHDCKKDRKIINAKDFMGNTALHFASKYNKPEFVKLLMKHGANVFVLNKQLYPPFLDISISDMNELLDDSITISSKLPSTDVKFALELNFRFLVPPPITNKETTTSAEKQSVSVDVEATNNTNISSFVPKICEMEPLLMITESRKHRELLKHPVIEGFLHLKWKKICWFFYVNFILYSLFTLVLSLHIYFVITPGVKLNSNTTLDEADSQSNGNSTLNETDSKSETSMEEVNTHNWLWVATLVLMVWPLLREITQMMLSFSTYFFSFENVMELLLILLTTFLLFSDFSHHTKQAMAAIAVLLAYALLVLLIGRHPRLSTYITMFLKVSQNFFRFLLWYSLLIFAFGFSFYIMFQDCSEDDSCEDTNLFEQLSTSIFKTIIMLTGEFDSTDIQFKSFLVTSHVIFMLFVFFIAIVLLNLLNGLAVSDIQAIRDDAELVSCIARIKFFAEIEFTLLGNPKKDYNRSCLPIKGWNFIEKIDMVKSMFGKKILLLSGALPKNKLGILINDYNRMEPDIRNSVQVMFDRIESFNLCRWCQSFNTIVSSAYNIASDRDKQSLEQQIMNRLESLEKKMKLQKEEENQRYQQILAKLDVVLDKLGKVLSDD